MRNLKKFLALVLAMLMIVGASAVSADFTDVEGNPYLDAINDLADKSIVQGTSTTTFGPTQGVTRTQMALFLARACTGETDDKYWANGVIPFADVVEHKGAIEYAYLNGIINGRNETTFDPNGSILYSEALKMAVCALGYGEGLTAGDYPYGYYKVAKEIGLTDNLEIDGIYAPLTRAQTAQIIYNMIYAVPADGGLTFAAENFDVLVVNTEDTFVITATPKQSYADGYTTDVWEGEGVAVGVQALVNGVPSGDVYHYLASDLGIADADVEKYFNRAVYFANFEDGKYDAVALGEEAVEVLWDDITVNADKNTLKIDDTTYYTVPTLTGTALKNEIVVFAGGADVNAAKILVTDKDGYVLYWSADTNQYVQAAVVAYTSPSGAKFYYDLLGATGTAGATLVPEVAILAAYGTITPDGAYLTYATMMAANVSATTYKLELYDDNGDGNFDRAIYYPIYLSVYNTYSDSSKDSIVYDLTGEDVAVAAVTYTNPAVKSKGTVFSFTWNAQLKEIDVIDIATKAVGRLDKVTNTQKSSMTDAGIDKNLKLNIAGTDYYMGASSISPNGTFTVSDKALGAQLIPRTDATNGLTYDTVCAGTALGHMDFYEFARTAKVGATYEFVVFNDFILVIDTVVPEDEAEVYDFVVMKEFTNVDLDSIYCDLWIDGAVAEDSIITTIGETSIDDLTFVGFVDFINDRAKFQKGLVYASQTVDGNVNLYETIEPTDTGADLYGLIKLDNTTVDGNVVFSSGVTRKTGNNATIAQAKRLRTNADTVYYFINTDATTGEKSVYAYVGSAANGTIAVTNDTVILTDKLGYTGDTKGIAGTVIIFEADLANTVGFGKMEVTPEYRFVMSNAKMENFTTVYGSEIGLTGTAANKVFYAYEGNGFDLKNLTQNTIYSQFKLEGSRVYLTNEKYIVQFDSSDVADPATTGWTGTPTVASDRKYYAHMGYAMTFDNYDRVTNWSTAAHPSSLIYDNIGTHASGLNFNRFWSYNNLPGSPVHAEFTEEGYAIVELLPENVWPQYSADADRVTDGVIIDVDDEITDIYAITLGGNLGDHLLKGQAAVNEINKDTVYQLYYCEDFLEDGVALFIYFHRAQKVS